MEKLGQDLKFGIRMMTQAPVVTAVAVLSLALGIGANTAMFSWLDSVLLHPLRAEEPERLVQLYTTHPGGFVYGSYSWPDFVDQREANDVFSSMAAGQFVPLSLSADGAHERLSGQLVSSNWFEFIGGAMAQGRGFLSDENEVPGRDAVVVLDHGLWQRRFGGREMVGETVRLNGRPFTVVGVAPEDFRLTAIGVDVDVYLPIMMRPVAAPDFSPLEARGARSMQVLARLEDGVTLAQAQDNLDAIAARLAEEYPGSNGEQGVLVVSAEEAALPPGQRGAVAGMFGVLMGVVGLVLLIACANVANLLLARASRRRQEVGMRLALGAGRGRLVRQLLTESLLLSLLAAGLGVALALWINRLIMGIQPPVGRPLEFDVPLSGTVLAFTAVAALVTGVLFGLAPAFQALRTDLVAALKEGRGGGGTGRSRLRGALVVGQIALSVVLLVGTGMFLRSLQNAAEIDPGFAPENLLVASVDPGLQGYEPGRADALYPDLAERLGALPGVRSVSFGEMLPFELSSQQWGASIDGYEPAPDERMNLDYNVVDGGYFETMGLTLRAGRGFTRADTADSEPVIVVNRTMAERYWEDGDPIGRTVTTIGAERTVVGVVEDSKYYTLGEDPLPFMYAPRAQTDQMAMNLLVRTEEDPGRVLGSVREAVRAIDPDLPLFDVKTMSDQMGNALLFPRLTASLLGSFGGLALLLASVGLYGVIAYSVAARTREIGIRIALGAADGDVLRLVLGQAGRLAAVGLGVGLTLGLAAAWGATSLLYDVSALDPAAFGGAVATILGVTLLASWFPARRATRIDPTRALRAE